MTAKFQIAFARQRAAILTVLVATTVFAWIWIAREADAGMQMNVRGLGLTQGMGLWPFMTMWVVMMVGMMFPSSAPMIMTFAAIQARRRSARRPYVPVSVFIASYMMIWVLFGFGAMIFAVGLDVIAERSDWLMTNWHRIAGGLLFAAGMYQFTPFKKTCLRKCRTPVSFLLEHWRDGWSGAFVMGLRHGLYCAGCCWLLFVILIPLGIMNLVAMGAVTVLVFAEKTAAQGDLIGRAAGLVLVTYGALVLVRPGLLPGPM